MNQPPVKGRIIAVVLLACVLPGLVSLAAHLLLGDAQRVQEPLHEWFETGRWLHCPGSSDAVVACAQHEKVSQHLFWVVASLIAMGLVDGLHGIHGISLRSWQRHGATLMGGVLMGLVWLPLPQAVTRRKGLFAFIVAGLAVALGLWWGSESMPVTWDPVGLYTFPVIAANTLGGAGFLAAALFFCRRYLRQPQLEDFMFASLAVVFGMSSSPSGSRTPGPPTRCMARFPTTRLRHPACCRLRHGCHPLCAHIPTRAGTGRPRPRTHRGTGKSQRGIAGEQG